MLRPNRTQPEPRHTPPSKRDAGATSEAERAIGRITDASVVSANATAAPDNIADAATAAPKKFFHVILLFLKKQ